MSEEVHVWRVPMNGGDPEELDKDSMSFAIFFQQEVPEFDAKYAEVICIDRPHFNVYHDLNMAKIKHNEGWEQLVRPSGRMIPAIRGPILIATLMEGPDWNLFVDEIGAYFHEHLQNALQHSVDKYIEREGDQTEEILALADGIKKNVVA